MNKEILEAARRCLKADQIGCKGCPLDDSLNITENCVNYIIENFLNHHEKYRWHDLRKDHTDLPEVEGHFNVCVWLKPNDAWGIEESYIYDTQYFCERFQSTRMSEVIAWKEIEPFESEEGDE